MPTEATRGAVPAEGSIEACARLLPGLLRDPEQPRLVFQPIVDLDRAVVAGYEALARFAVSPPVAPDVWFAAAAAGGLAAELERRVVRRVLAARSHLPPNCFLTVNVSPQALTTDDVLDEFRHGGDLAGIFVELTEQQHVLDLAATHKALEELRQHGAMIAMDDAGSGYSGLQRLVALRPELMKIDRSLVSGIDSDEAKKACVEMLRVLAGRLDAWLLAEGVETPEELRTLVSLEVPLAQGFLLGHPVDDWRGLDARTTARIRVAARELLGSRQLVRLVERVAIRTPEAAEPPGSSDVVVCLDGDGRPASLLINSDAGRPRTVPVTLQLPATTPITEAARQCLDRPQPYRFDPVLCVHEDGTVAGIVHAERIFDFLTRR
ncbi:diguanylate phosphodiesterase [Acidothermus cellulolyticus 11B]|uniref:Diguanylate phosphodiesterase n=1 Tax=Acidothermus cellulolyticus (strain ATCC 43068 / DSM 8971 / 11B) TaxID=351607 RepID=A0LS92_ACIC1|nr:EAL domain-containing protein [Acidothermus cellulolyticus]ABK52302.1 diguanylate phosphodiesterase [Acidothermus cellulolyticus 11B]